MAYVCKVSQQLVCILLKQEGHEALDHSPEFFLKQKLCNFGRGRYEDLCEIIPNLDQVFRRCKDFFPIFSSGGILFSRAEPFVQF